MIDMPLDFIYSAARFSLHYGNWPGRSQNLPANGALLKLQKETSFAGEKTRAGARRIILVGAAVCATGSGVLCLACSLYDEPAPITMRITPSQRGDRDALTEKNYRGKGRQRPNSTPSTARGN